MIDDDCELQRNRVAKFMEQAVKNMNIDRKYTFWREIQRVFWESLAARLALIIAALASVLAEKGLDLLGVWWGDLIRASLARL